MDIKSSIMELIKCIKIESRLIDKMLVALENQNDEQFLFIQETYKNKREKTDSAILSLLQKYSFDDIFSCISSFKSSSCEEYITNESLAEIILDDIFYVYFMSKYDKNTLSYQEEHIKYLLSVYLWDFKNSELTDIQKSKIHKLILTKLGKSSFVRSYFAGDVEFAQNVSTPDESLGKLIADKEALHTYYSLLNKLVKQCNYTEFFEGLDSRDNCVARRKLAELQLAALSVQMNKRDIIYPVLETNVSDYAEDRIANASILATRYSNNEVKKTQKVIKL